jgi:hypothetical protein
VIVLPKCDSIIVFFLYISNYAKLVLNIFINYHSICRLKI